MGGRTAETSAVLEAEDSVGVFLRRGEGIRECGIGGCGVGPAA